MLHGLWGPIEHEWWRLQGAECTKAGDGQNWSITHQNDHANDAKAGAHVVGEPSLCIHCGSFSVFHPTLRHLGNFLKSCEFHPSVNWVRFLKNIFHQFFCSKQPELSFLAASKDKTMNQKATHCEALSGTGTWCYGSIQPEYQVLKDQTPLRTCRLVHLLVGNWACRAKVTSRVIWNRWWRLLWGRRVLNMAHAVLTTPSTLRDALVYRSENLPGKRPEFCSTASIIRATVLQDYHARKGNHAPKKQSANLFSSGWSRGASFRYCFLMTASLAACSTWRIPYQSISVPYILFLDRTVNVTYS